MRVLWVKWVNHDPTRLIEGREYLTRDRLAYQTGRVTRVIQGSGRFGGSDHILLPLTKPHHSFPSCWRNYLETHTITDVFVVGFDPDTNFLITEEIYPKHRRSFLEILLAVSQNVAEFVFQRIVSKNNNALPYALSFFYFFFKFLAFILLFFLVLQICSHTHY